MDGMVILSNVIFVFTYITSLCTGPTTLTSTIYLLFAVVVVVGSILFYSQEIFTTASIPKYSHFQSTQYIPSRLIALLRVCSSKIIFESAFDESFVFKRCLLLFECCDCECDCECDWECTDDECEFNRCRNGIV